MTSLPIRERILDRLAELLTAHRAPTLQDFQAEAVIGLTDEEESAEVMQDVTRLTMAIRVEQLLRIDDAAHRATASNTALSTLVYALHTAAADDVLSPLLERIEYTVGSTLYPPEESRIAGAYVQANIVYWTDTGNPYVYTAFD